MLLCAEVPERAPITSPEALTRQIVNFSALTKLPDHDPQEILSIINKHGVHVIPSQEVSGVNFVVFWMDSQPWLATFSLDAEYDLSIVPAWNDKTGGVLLTAFVNDQPFVVGQVTAGHIRRAITKRHEQVPSRFQLLRIAFSIRYVHTDGVVKNVRVERADLEPDEIKAYMEDPIRQAAWLKTAKAYARQHGVKSAVIFARADKNPCAEVEEITLF